MQVANRQKGCSFFRTRVTGREGHSSAPERGVNAIVAAVRDHRRDRPARRRGARPRPPENGFDPPHTTLSVGTIAGGTAVNIIARECSFEWDLRNIPDDDAAALKARLDRFIAADLLPRMRAVYPDAAVETETVVAVPPLVPEKDSPAEVAGPTPDRRQHDDHRVVRHRGRALPAGRHPGDRLRPGLDRGGAQARRIHHPRRTRRRPSLSRPPARLGDGGIAPGWERRHPAGNSIGCAGELPASAGLPAGCRRSVSRTGRRYGRRGRAGSALRRLPGGRGGSGRSRPSRRYAPRECRARRIPAGRARR